MEGSQGIEIPQRPNMRRHQERSGLGSLRSDCASRSATAGGTNVWAASWRSSPSGEVNSRAAVFCD